MAALALHGTVRRVVARLHRWTGLVIMACMLVAAVTGVWLTFRVEMDRLVNPELRTVLPRATRVPLAAIADDVAKRFPNAAIHTFMLQERADDSISVYLDSRDGSPLALDRLFIDPYTGAFLGGSNTRALVFARANVDTLIDRLHYSLWIDTWGLPLMGVVAGIWLITSCVGLILAWPRFWFRAARWIPVLSVRSDRGSYQANYQLHRAIGVWLFPVLIVLAFTSFYQNMPQYVRPLVNALSPLATRPSGRAVPDTATVITPDRALESLTARFPEADAQSIGVDRAQGRYSILFRLPGDLSTNGDNWVFVDLVTGDVVGERIAAMQGAGDKFLTWIFPLHTGTAFGLPGRVVIAGTGVGLAAMLVSGFYVWGVKWQMRRRSRVPKRSLGRAAAALLVLAVASQASAQSNPDPQTEPVAWLKTYLGGAACVVYDAGPSPFRLEHVSVNTEVQFDGCRMVLQQATVTGSRSEVRTFEIPLAALAVNSVTSSRGFPLPEGWTSRGDVPTHTITIKSSAGQNAIDERVEQFDGTPPRSYQTDVVTVFVRHEENASQIVRAMTRAIELCRR